MKIADLILCHRDAEHVARLAAKLTTGAPDNHLFVHVDAKSPESAEFASRLLEASHAAGDFERFVLLQGADYPLKSNAAIAAFFDKHRETGCIAPAMPRAARPERSIRRVATCSSSTSPTCSRRSATS